MRYAHSVLAVMAILMTIGCTLGEVNGCQLHPGSSSNPYGLSYDGRQPTKCPVPLGAIGEYHSIGGVVTGYSTAPLANEIIEVDNSAGVYKNMNGDFFQQYQGKKQALPVVDYEAATGSQEFLYDGSTPLGSEDYSFWNSYDYNATILETGHLTVTYKGALVNTSVAGNDLPLHNTSQSWTVSASNGSTPYTYTWYREGQQVSQTATYATTVDTAAFGLHIDVVDAQGRQGHKDMLIDVDGIRATISGPQIVYLSDGGGTWSATGRGGAYSYVFDWYVADENGDNPQWQARGSSWTGYPGEGYHLLIVQITNGTAKQSSYSVQVQGVGNASCSPVPPAVTC
jgi:hypothetical protein